MQQSCMFQFLAACQLKLQHDTAMQVKEGDEVQPGDMLCDVETDKATMGWENQDDGFIAKILKVRCNAIHG